MTLLDEVTQRATLREHRAAVAKAAPATTPAQLNGPAANANPVQADLPQSWIAALMGPGWPITPFGAGSQRNASAETEPRSFQYVPNVNATLSPRIGYGLTPFSQLMYWAEFVPEVALCRRLLIEELKNFTPQILDPDGNVVQKARVVVHRDRRGRPLYDKHGNLMKTFTGENEFQVQGLEWMTTCPNPATKYKGKRNTQVFTKFDMQVPAR